MEQQLESIQNTTRTEKEKAKAEIDTAKKAAEAEKSRANDLSSVSTTRKMSKASLRPPSWKGPSWHRSWSIT